jgi:WD40 repeat protein
VIKLEGHHGEIWALAVGKYGSIIVTGSHDRSIRIWEKSDEQVCVFILFFFGNFKHTSYFFESVDLVCS